MLEKTKEHVVSLVAWGEKISNEEAALKCSKSLAEGRGWNTLYWFYSNTGKLPNKETTEVINYVVKYGPTGAIMKGVITGPKKQHFSGLVH